MKFTLSWLKDHLETEVPVEAIAERLTMLGLEVEEVIDRAAEFAPFTVAEVTEVAPHPNADKLTLCTVDTGTGRVQVVCGAPNAHAGMKGVFAPAGARLPGTGLELKKAKIRGVMSEGMLCSEAEIGIGEDEAGIIELPEDAVVGEPFAPALGLDDPVIDVAVTPNRADCLGVRGIARDLAAAGLGRLKPREAKPVPAEFNSPIAVKFDLPGERLRAAPCVMFAGRYLRGLANRPSPDWLQRRLIAIGLRPISALVDVTNYITIDRARPLHVFDADTLAGDLVVRLGKRGERLLGLDGKEYELDDEMTVIADDDGALSLGGVIGGEPSGCTESTVNVYLECALFDPVRTAATGRKLMIESDARYRFERGVDPASVISGIEAATAMILELCGGEASDVVVAGGEPDWRRDVRLEPARVHHLGGVDLPEDQTRRILESLGFQIRAADGALAVSVPSWRGDVAVVADLVEEVLRIYGYDKIPVVSFPRESALPPYALTPADRRAALVRRRLSARAMVEAVTWSFMSEGDAALFGGVDERLRLMNPISADLDVMRPSPLPNLVAAAGRNANRGFADVALFEIGPAYSDDTPEGQALVAAGLRAGDAAPRNWASPPRPVDAFDAKADALAGLDALGVAVESLQVLAEAPAWYHPGRAGTLALGPKQVLGHFGELHPEVLSAMDVKGPVSAFELFLDAVPEPKRKAGRPRPPFKPSPFQALERDFAFLVDESVPAEAVVSAARAADKALITEVSVFDVYTGPGVEPGKKSLAIAVTLQPTDKTLTDEEIEAVASRIVASVTKATGGVLRG
ncbi:MAG: phenylalanine--tRNA ligase subunit beta [Alphaproteobacteria bacterium]